jgi:hypothetical protein
MSNFPTVSGMMNTFSVIRNNRNEIISYDCQSMAVDAELLNSFSSSIYQPKPMRLSSGEFEGSYARIAFAWGRISQIDGQAIEVVSSINQIVVGSWKLLSISKIHREKNVRGIFTISSGFVDMTPSTIVK